MAMAPGSKRFTLTFVQYMGSVCFLLQIVSVEADGKLFTVESRNSSQDLDLTAAQKLCTDLGARLATAEELRRAVMDCSFAACTRGWLADGTVRTMVCSKTGSNQQSVKAIDVNIENDPSPSGRYNAFCVKDEDKPCGDPPSFPHTILHGHTGFEMGDELLYVCAQGYVMGNKETAFTLLCDSCGEWYGQVQACVKDETEAHIDYEDNFPDDRSMPVAEHEEEPGKEEGEEEQEQEFSHPKETEAENVGSSKDVTQGIDSTEKGSKAPTESPVSLLSQKHLFWFPAESFNEPESDKDTNDATKTQFSDGNNHIGVKTIYNEPGNKMIYDSKDFPIGPVLVNNDTKAMKDTVTNTDESWLDGYPVTQEAVEDDEEEDKVDGSMGTEDDIILTTDQPNHVEVRKAGNSNPAPDKDLTQIVAAPTRMRDYGIKEIPLVLTPTSAPENVSASKGSEDVIRYHPTTSLGFVTQESTTTTTQHDRPNLKTATLKTSTTVSPIDHIPYPETEETTAFSTQAATTIPTREVFTDSLSNEFLEQENLTYGTGEKLLPTSEPCVGEDCPSPNKDPMIAIIVIVLCLLLFASILAVWCFKKRQQKSSVYKLNGKGQARHPHHHQQIEMQKV
ncbi:sushi domain-containing protein 5 [Trachemys scripta elegans]|uniref:sushi domain-containing protein 5 n=1 Tax=Trachemys scripta elegans TaxID=31138 RepID=UPI0015536466|nr:sushi domain-containing protein 5 [Trachemys scripta elegans]